MSTLLHALRRAQQPQPSVYTPAMASPITGRPIMGGAIPKQERRTPYPIGWLLASLALLLGAAANYGWQLIHLRPIEEQVEITTLITAPFVRVEPKAMITRPLPPPLPIPVAPTPKAVSRPEPQSQQPQRAPNLAEQLQQALNDTPLQAAVNPLSPSEPVSHLITLSHAPASVRQLVPALRYGSHIFSSHHAKRAVVLNGQEYREGSDLAPHVRLAAISPQFIVLDVAGQQVTLKALQDWRG
ncbi:MAG: type II secretion system assembly factor GspB [Aeromonas sp.]